MNVRPATSNSLARLARALESFEQEEATDIVRGQIRGVRKSRRGGRDIVEEFYIGEERFVRYDTWDGGR